FWALRFPASAPQCFPVKSQKQRKFPQAGSCALLEYRIIVHEPERRAPLSCSRVFATLLPALLFAKFRDMRSVMLPMPLVKEQQPVHRALAVFRMNENPRKMLGLQRAPQLDKSSVHRIQQRLRNFNRRGLGVSEFGPGR